MVLAGRGDAGPRAWGTRARQHGSPVAVSRSERIGPEQVWANLDEMLALAKYPNVAIKATGAPSCSSGPYPYRDIHDHLRRIYDASGPARMFWGTDITRMPCSWRQCVTMFTEELPWLSPRDKELIMGRALCTWLDWTLPAEGKR
jgi:predicted TIM-barrel fold metal-dependent hydrolase